MDSTKVRCPKCNQYATHIGTHYFCENPSCGINKYEDDAEKLIPVQFRLETDKEVRFPYNIIFASQPKEKFYRVPYLVISDPGV